MTDTVSVRVTDGDVWVDGEHLTRGDEVELPIGVYERLPGSFEAVDEAADTEDVDDEAAASEESDDGTKDIDPHPGELTVDEIEERVADVDDVATLEAIRDLEAETEDRTTALEAIDDRIDELEG